MNNNKSIYITINHLDEFMATMSLRVGDVLALKKDPDNIYDDEAILVYDKNNCKVGYVANSVSTVARGTFSAGRIFDRIGEDNKSVICFITEECAIGIILDDQA